MDGLEQGHLDAAGPEGDQVVSPDMGWDATGGAGLRAYFYTGYTRVTSGGGGG